MTDGRIPNVWVKFLLSAEDHFVIYGSIKKSILEFKADISDAEIDEVEEFLNRVSDLPEEGCRAETTHPNSIIDATAYKPTNCVEFYRIARDVFQGGTS